MAVAEDKDLPPATKLTFHKGFTILTGSVTVTGGVIGLVWYLLSPRIDKYIDDHIAEKQKVHTTLAAAPGATTVFSANDLQVSELKHSVEVLSSAVAEISARAAELRNQIGDLSKVVTEIKTRANFSATYGYSFRFKGSEILAQQRPPSRLYFFATRDDEVKVTIYLATQKFPVTLKVDGIPVRPTLRDSREKVRVTDLLVHTSLEEVTAVKDGAHSKEGGPPTVEDPRPENVHYIEFVPGDVNYLFGKNDDYDVSGIILVAKKTI